MKSFQQKKEELASLKEKLAKAKIIIFSSFAREGEKGLKVSEMRELKKGLRAADSEYLVGKKTLMGKALKAAGKEINIFGYDGSVGLSFGYGDGLGTAKALYGFAKKNPALKLFGAIWGDRLLNPAELLEFAKLPSKEVLIGRLMGLMKYPLLALANVLGQVKNQRVSL